MLIIIFQKDFFFLKKKSVTLHIIEVDLQVELESFLKVGCNWCFCDCYRFFFFFLNLRKNINDIYMYCNASKFPNSDGIVPESWFSQRCLLLLIIFQISYWELFFTKYIKLSFQVRLESSQKVYYLGVVYLYFFLNLVTCFTN